MVTPPDFDSNPRGITGYGYDFDNEIHHNYPGADYHDLMAGVDAVDRQSGQIIICLRINQLILDKEIIKLNFTPSMGNSLVLTLDTQFRY